MKIIIKDKRIIATASDEYTGPDEFMQVPEGFDVAKLERCRAEQWKESPFEEQSAGVDDYIAAMDAMYDAKAKERRYFDRYTCSLRAGYPGPFQPEGLAFATWMDSCNIAGYQMLAAFQAGEIEQPTVAELLASLPEMVWP